MKKERIMYLCRVFQLTIRPQAFWDIIGVTLFMVNRGSRDLFVPRYDSFPMNPEKKKLIP